MMVTDCSWNIRLISKRVGIDTMTDLTKSNHSTYMGINFQYQVAFLYMMLWMLSCENYDLERSNQLEENNGTTVNTFTDSRDGHVYQTVQIGDQTWMAENLNYQPATGAWWYYNNNPANGSTYGVLYDWSTARNVAPSGWHLPSKTEWDIFLAYLGGSGNPAYTKMILGGTTGFEAQFGGFRYSDGQFQFMGDIGEFWSSTGIDGTYAYYCDVSSYSENAIIYGGYKAYGFSVRCIKN